MALMHSRSEYGGGSYKPPKSKQRELAANDEITAERLKQVGFRDKGDQFSSLIFEVKTKGDRFVCHIEWLNRFECLEVGGVTLPHFQAMGQVYILIQALKEES